MRNLSEREKEVLTLVADGLVNERIGARLYITKNTVKKHMERIMTALGAKSRTHAVAIALRTGEIK